MIATKSKGVDRFIASLTGDVPARTLKFKRG